MKSDKPIVFSDQFDWLRLQEPGTSAPQAVFNGGHAIDDLTFCHLEQTSIGQKPYQKMEVNKYGKNRKGKGIMDATGSR